MSLPEISFERSLGSLEDNPEDYQEPWEHLRTRFYHRHRLWEDCQCTTAWAQAFDPSRPGHVGYILEYRPDPRFVFVWELFLDESFSLTKEEYLTSPVMIPYLYNLDAFLQDRVWLQPLTRVEGRYRGLLELWHYVHYHTLPPLNFAPDRYQP